uniref:NAC domain-containing protein n=1 Tax=Tanacetum cinerariifolium TaxID=118510 RepID=A0A6L2N8D0_TANCI|nr:NAC domain-containing protein [Tanacetum cinerariifolium]
MINQEKLNMDFQNELNRLQEMMSLINLNQDPPVDLCDLEGSDKGDNNIDSLTKKPLNTFLIGAELISTTPERENDEFIKSSVDDLVPIPRESEVTLVCDLECNSDSVPRSYDVTFSNPLFDFNDDYTLCYDNPLFDEEFKDISSLDPLKSPPVINESTLLVTPLPDYKEIYLREVERFYPFFSLTQSGGRTRVMETPSFGFHHIPSPHPAAYSPKKVMYCYYHPHLTSGDGFDHGPKMK